MDFSIDPLKIALRERPYTARQNKLLLAATRRTLTFLYYLYINIQYRNKSIVTKN
jgi:hypothetical protein